MCFYHRIPCCLFHRQAHCNTGATVDQVFCRHFSTVLFDKLLYDRQSESGTFSLRGYIGVELLCQGFGIDTWTIVSDLYLGKIFTRFVKPIGGYF